MAGVGDKIRLHFFDFDSLGQVIKRNNRYGAAFGKPGQLLDVRVKFLRFGVFFAAAHIKYKIFGLALLFQNFGNGFDKIV